MWIDGKMICTNKPAAKGQAGSPCSSEFDYTFNDTAEHDVRFEYSHVNKFNGAGVLLQWAPPAEPIRQRAIDIAKNSDLVLAFVGLSADLEGEEMPVHVEGFDGGDRTSIDLPKTQQQLLDAVAATGKPVVVVLMSGSAVALNWANEHANAVLEAWYPGELGGKAIAYILNGTANPSGRLPITF